MRSYMVRGMRILVVDGDGHSIETERQYLALIEAGRNPGGFTKKMNVQVKFFGREMAWEVVEGIPQ